MNIRRYIVFLSIIATGCGQTSTNTDKPMIKNTELFFKQIRTAKLQSNSNLNFEINLADKGVSKSDPLTSDNSDLNKLKDNVPPSFINFIRNFANGLYIKIGNELTIFPIGQNIGDYWTDVSSLTTETINDSLFPSKEFIFFGMSGVDSEMFGFYTGTKLDNGEYPIVWFTPGSVDTKPFVLLNTSFDKFLSIQYYLLKSTEYEETYSTLEEAEKALDSNSLKESNKNWENFFSKLYDTFDPSIPKPNPDYYKSAVSLTELKEQIEELKNNNRKLAKR